MRESIINSAEQFGFEPKLENARRLKYAEHAILVGMGGSALAADILKAWHPEANIIIHRNYGLPELSDKDLKKRLIILSSYSGNTEEVLDAFEAARKRKLRVVIIASGGKLLQTARQEKLPYVELPRPGIQPRLAIGYSFRALLSVLGLYDELEESVLLKETLKPLELEKAGKEVAMKLKGRVPVIVAAERNFAVAYNWKILFNETGKVPAFVATLPELNHNEMTGFTGEGSRALSKNFGFVFLTDAADHPRIQKRFAVLEKIYGDKELVVQQAPVEGESRLTAIWKSIMTADWAALQTAELYKNDADDESIVEEFKKLIRE